MEENARTVIIDIKDQQEPRPVAYVTGLQTFNVGDVIYLKGGKYKVREVAIIPTQVRTHGATNLPIYSIQKGSTEIRCVEV
jgi:hypothetical protein